MLIHPDFDPVIFTLGPVAVRWYGMMYLVGFVGGWWLGRVRASKPGSGWTPSQIDDLLFLRTTAEYNQGEETCK